MLLTLLGAAMADPAADPGHEADGLREELRRQKEAVALAHARLTAIHASTAWTLVRTAYSISRRLLPPHTVRYCVVRKCARGVAKLLKSTRRPAPAEPIAVPTLAVSPPRAPADIITEDSAYARWIWLNEPLAGELNAQRQFRFSLQPTVSVIVPVFNPPAEYLAAMLDSVLAQTYSHWELCIADGGSTAPHVAPLLREYAARDSRIKVHFLVANRGIAANTNAAIAAATGEFVAFLDHDDTLAPFALFEMVRALNNHREADLIYSDEDKIDPLGRCRFRPHFKPDWSPDMLRSHNYICHQLMVRRELLDNVGGLRNGFDGAQDHDLVLRATEQARQIVHVPQVLYHWRAHPDSTAQDRGAKEHASPAGARAVAEHLDRIGWPGEVTPAIVPGTYTIRYVSQTRPLISIIIANHNQADLLRQCIASIERSSYSNVEIVIAENGSREPATHAFYDELRTRPNVRIVEWKEPFNYAAVNNFAVRHATGEMLLLLNNDTDALHADWLERMLEHAVRPEVGAVGAKLYYPDGTVQHAGVILGMGANAAHLHQFAPGDHPGYFGRLTYVQNFSAVTAACLMCRREVFDEVGGFDEQFALCYNDVDFCLKLRAKGYSIVWTPEARLRHHESKTRGPDNTPAKAERFRRESTLFWERWGDLLRRGDPYYSPNLSLTDCHASIRA
jgi:GT2 family glycosyltransferase